MQYAELESYIFFTDILGIARAKLDLTGNNTPVWKKNLYLERYNRLSCFHGELTKFLLSDDKQSTFNSSSLKESEVKDIIIELLKLLECNTELCADIETRSESLQNFVDNITTYSRPLPS